jgi:hypothetical protein
MFMLGQVPREDRLPMKALGNREPHSNRAKHIFKTRTTNILRKIGLARVKYDCDESLQTTSVSACTPINDVRKYNISVCTESAFSNRPYADRFASPNVLCRDNSIRHPVA